jgi:hypothetical protein
MSQRSYSKNEYILDPRSDWNNAADDEPIFVVRANNWRAVIFLAALLRTNEATGWCLNVAERMKAWGCDEDDKIPF